MIDSPLNESFCQLCKQRGYRRISGRLLYIDGDRWVHANCALWSDEVREVTQDGSLSGILHLLKSFKSSEHKCDQCNEKGSSIICMG